jgi:hypothetical protein
MKKRLPGPGGGVNQTGASTYTVRRLGLLALSVPFFYLEFGFLTEPL